MTCAVDANNDNDKSSSTDQIDVGATYAASGGTVFNVSFHIESTSVSQNVTYDEFMPKILRNELYSGRHQKFS